MKLQVGACNLAFLMRCLRKKEAEEYLSFPTFLCPYRRMDDAIVLLGLYVIMKRIGFVTS